jgi:peptide/nickel transport system ATP-binding protein
MFSKMKTGMRALLRVEELRVEFPTEDGLVRAVDGVSFTVERGSQEGGYSTETAGVLNDHEFDIALRRLHRRDVEG